MLGKKTWSNCIYLFIYFWKENIIFLRTFLFSFCSHVHIFIDLESMFFAVNVTIVGLELSATVKIR